MTDNEIVLYIAIWFFAFLFIMKILTANEGEWWNQINVNNYTSPNNAEKTNKYKKLEREQINLENIKIKRDETENNINKLKIEALTDFEKEDENQIKIRKLEQQVKQANIKIGEKENEINQIIYEIQWMS